MEQKVGQVDPVGLFGSNQKAEGNLCDFRAISWEVEEVEVGERGRTTRKAENADYHE